MKWKWGGNQGLEKDRIAARDAAEGGSRKLGEGRRRKSVKKGRNHLKKGFSGSAMKRKRVSSPGEEW